MGLRLQFGLVDAVVGWGGRLSCCRISYVWLRRRGV